MAGSAFDRHSYTLECPRCHVIETVVLRELKRLQSWRCSTCSHEQDLSLEPHRTALAKEFAAAEKEDRDRRAKGKAIEPD
jgi:transposase-like protein